MKVIDVSIGKEKIFFLLELFKRRFGVVSIYFVFIEEMFFEFQSLVIILFFFIGEFWVLGYVVFFIIMSRFQFLYMCIILGLSDFLFIFNQFVFRKNFKEIRVERQKEKDC